MRNFMTSGYVQRFIGGFVAGTIAIIALQPVLV